MTVGFQYQLIVLVYSFTRFQRQSVLFRYEISTMVSFAGSRGLDDGRFSVSVGFASIMRFQRQLVLLSYEISLMVSFILLKNFNNSRFCLVMTSQ